MYRQSRNVGAVLCGWKHISAFLFFSTGVVMLGALATQRAQKLHALPATLIWHERKRSVVWSCFTKMSQTATCGRGMLFTSLTNPQIGLNTKHNHTKDNLKWITLKTVYCQLLKACKQFTMVHNNRNRSFQHRRRGNTFAETEYTNRVLSERLRPWISGYNAVKMDVVKKDLQHWLTSHFQIVIGHHYMLLKPGWI